MLLTLGRRRPALVALILSFGALLAACGGSSGGDEVLVAGDVQHASSYSVGDLAKLPPTTQTVTFTSSGASQTHVYTGTLLQGLLDAAVVNVDAAIKNDILNRYVLTTGADGYRVVFAAGEINPNFGNRPSIVAYAETAGGVTSPLTDDRPARITSPGDVKGGRYVSNLTRIDVRQSGSAAAGVGGGLSTQFTVSGAVLRPGTYDLAALQALVPVITTVGTSTFTGVSLWTFLNTVVGLQTEAGAKNPTLAMYVVATGSDGYRTLLSLGEIDPGFGNQPDLIAYDVNGTGLGSNGFSRIVVPNDVKAGRWVSNLVALEVFVAPAAP